jgi:hypothetical protein
MEEDTKDDIWAVLGQVLPINLGFPFTVLAKPAPTSANEMVNQSESIRFIGILYSQNYLCRTPIPF